MIKLLSLWIHVDSQSKLRGVVATSFIIHVTHLNSLGLCAGLPQPLTKISTSLSKAELIQDTLRSGTVVSYIYLVKEAQCVEQLIIAWRGCKRFSSDQPIPTMCIRELPCLSIIHRWFHRFSPSSFKADAL